MDVHVLIGPLWRYVWSLNVPEEITSFFWGVIHQIFASMTTLCSCKIPVNIVFPCYGCAETITGITDALRPCSQSTLKRAVMQRWEQWVIADVLLCCCLL